VAKKKKSARFRAFQRLALSRDALALVAVLLAVIGLGLLERYVWFGALVRELGFHLACVALLAGAIALIRRAFAVGAALLAFALLFAWPLYPLYRPTKPTPPLGPLLRVATAHLAGAELTTQALASWLGQKRPDAIALTGLHESRSVGSRFDGYRVLRGAADLRSLLLVQSALFVPTRERAGEHASAVVRAGRCQARLLTLDLPPLAAYTALEARKRAIASLAKRQPAPRAVWLGHLGSRAEAHDLSVLSAKNSLRSVRIGHGRLATAPAAWGFLGFPLSDALVHGWISIREAELEPPLALGAHRTLRAVVELTEPRCRIRVGTAIE
jgi:hypothetical protein